MNISRQRISIVFGKLFISLFIGLSSNSHSSTTRVSTNADVANPAGCSFREAVESIVNGGPIATGCLNEGAEFGHADQVSFDFLEQTIVSLTFGTISLSVDMEVLGNGADQITVSGLSNGDASVLAIDGAVVSIHGLSVAGGITSDNGGGISVINEGELTLSNSVVSSNFGNRDGGINVEGNSKLFLRETIIADNESVSGGGGFRIYNASHLGASNSTISNNTGRSGGGVSVFLDSSADITISTFSKNAAPADVGNGGAIFIRESVLSVRNSTFSDNHAGFGGGRLSAYDAPNVSFINVTMIDNSSDDRGGGVLVSDSTMLRISNSIVAGNTAPQGAEITLYDSIQTNVSEIVANRKNLFGISAHTDGQAFEGFTPGVLDIRTTSSSPEPKTLLEIVKLIASNDGITQTYALLEGSPAVNAADQSTCVAEMITVDQRGEERLDGRCDIGSFELPGEPLPIEGSICFPIRSGPGKSALICM